MALDGLKVMIYTGIILIILCFLLYLYPILPLKIGTAVLVVLFVFNLFFFRDPERDVPAGENIILAPADGKIIKIEEVNEPYYLKEHVRCVSIFLSIFNVHVTRIPVDGVVEYLEYNRGKFFPAFADKASLANEQSIIGIRNERGRILFKQIAGIIARRVIYHLTQGERVTKGARFGMIRYGSRVDIFIPQNVVLKVKLNDTVYGGETIIGEFE